MSRQIDERVVSMQFDNKHFENNVRDTMNTLEKLKQKLHLPGASKGLESINSAAKNVNMTGLSNGIEAVRTRFSAMEIVGITALANIANSAVNAGKRMISALTIDPIKTGFNEYETKINSVQTIMSNTASKGTTMADVTRVLEELNKYADMTIYNFAEMTRNIGTFTAAGVGLEESAAAIQGIANLAAASGSNSQQASTAMYQLSQALATGTVKLMDWNSVVNAGMGGEKFQEALKATAREHGVAVDSIIEKNGSFRDSLQEGWLSADILNNTLKKFTVDGAKEYAQSMIDSGKYTREQADALIKEAEAMNDAATKVKTFTQLWDTLKEAAQSGWAQTWELIVGDFEEAKTFLSGLSDLFGGIIDASSKARNELLGGALNSKWDQLAGKIEAAGLSTDTFKAKIIEAAKAGGIPIDDLIKKHGTLEAVISKGLIPVKIIKDAFMKLLGAEKEVTETTKELGDVVNRVINLEFGTGEERIKALTDAGYDYATVQNLVNEKLGSGVRHLSELSEEQVKNADSLVKLSDAQLKEKGYTEEQIVALKELKAAADGSGTSINELIESLDKPSGRELLLDSFHNVLNTCVKSAGALRDAWREIFPPMTSDQLYNIISGLNKFTSYLSMSDENADKLKRTFKGLFAILDIVLTVVGGPIKILFKALTQLLGMFDLNILDVTASIGDAIVGFRDWIDSCLDFTKIFEKIMPYLVTFVKGIRNGVNAIKDSNMFNIALDFIQGFINGLKKGVPHALSEIINFGKFILEKLKGILGIHSPSTETFAIALDTVQGYTNGFKEGSTSVFEAIKGFNSKIFELLSKIDIGKILALGLGVTSVLAGKKMLDIMEMFAAPLAGLGEMFEGIGGMFIGLKSMFKGIGASFRASAFKKSAQAVLIFAVAIGVLVGALWLLTKIDDDDLWECVGVLAALTAMVAALAIATSKMGAVKGLAAQALSILLISAALYILVKAIDKMASMEDGDILKGIASIAALTLLVIAMIAVSKLAGEFSKGSGVMLLKISIALLIMIGIIKIISGMSVDDITKGIVVIAVFEILIVGLIAVSKLAGEYSGKSGSMLLKISLALLVMIGIIKIISGMSAGEIAKGITVIALIEGLFVALIAVSQFAGQNSAKAGVMLLMMAAAMLILVVVINQASKLDGSGIAKGLAVITVLEVLFGALIAVSQFAGKNAIKAGVMLLTMSFALIILAGVLFILSELDPSGLGRALAVVATLEILFGGLIAVTKIAQDVSKTLIVLIVAIGILVAAVAILSFIDPESLKVAAASLSAIIGTFALLVAASQYTKDVKIAPLLAMVGVVAALAAILFIMGQLDVKSTLETVAALSILMLTLSAVLVIIDKAGPTSMKSVGVLAVMGLVVAELAGILYALSYLNADSALQNALALSTLLTAMSAAMFILSKSGIPIGAIGAAMLMGLVLAELVGIFYLMDLLDVKGPSLETAIGLSALLLALSGACVILSIVGAAAPAALMGALALAGVVGIIGTLLVALGALAQLPGLKWLVDEGGQLLQSIGQAIGGFVGGLVGGIAEGVTASLPQLGTNLSDFMTNLQPFMDGIKTIDSSVLENAKTLSQLILTLTAANLIESITSWITGGSSMSEFASQLIPFGQAMVAFSAVVSGNIDGEAVTAAANAGKVMAEMAATIPNSGGIVEWFTGENSMSDFMAQLVPFGNAMVAFSSTVSGKIDEGAVIAAANAGKMMAEMAATIPNSGGVVGWFTGENDIATFGTQLVSFGNAIVNFSSKVSGNIDEAAVTAAANAGKMMVELADTIPNTDGVVSWFTGDNDMATFGTQLVSFGNAMADFSEAVSGNIDVAAVTTVANAGKSLADMANKLPNTGGFWSKIVGDNGMDAFGAQLVAFGDGISDFSSAVSDVSVSSINIGVMASKRVLELSGSVQNGGPFPSGFNGATFKSQLLSFAKAIKEFASEISEIDGGKISSDIADLKKVTQSLKGIGESGVTEFTNAFSNSGTKVSQAISSMLKSASNTISSKKGEFKDSGKILVTELTNGIESQKTKPSTSLDGVMRSAVSAVKSESVYSGAYSAGSRFVQGFANGISANTYMASAKSRAMALAAKNAAEDALDINSPSKVGYGIGGFFGIGFVNALHDYSSKAYNASSKMAKSAKSGLSDAISKVGDMFSGNLNVQPTIRPVLDLSDVTTGARAINGMLNTKPSMGVLSNIGAINSSMSRRQNGINNDVVSAIKRLEGTISNLSSNQYTINGITYDDGSNITKAVESIVRAARVERRV